MSVDATFLGRRAKVVAPFAPLPDQPPFSTGVWFSLDQWVYLPGDAFTHYRLSVAIAAGVLLTERRGPRRGWRYSVASIEAWQAWVTTYNARAQRRHEAMCATAVARALTAKVLP